MKQRDITRKMMATFVQNGRQLAGPHFFGQMLSQPKMKKEINLQQQMIQMFAENGRIMRQNNWIYQSPHFGVARNLSLWEEALNHSKSELQPTI